MPDRYLSFPTAEASLYEYLSRTRAEGVCHPRLDVPLLRGMCISIKA